MEIKLLFEGILSIVLFGIFYKAINFKILMQYLNLGKLNFSKFYFKILFTVVLIGFGFNGLNAQCVKPNTPSPSSPNGPASPCEGATGITYSVNTLANATSYVWTYPSDWIVTSGAGTNSITFTIGQSSGNVTVKGVNACGEQSDNSSQRYIGITAKPSAPGQPTSYNNTCNGFTAQWGTNGAQVDYLVDVSTDANFTNFIDGYQNLNVGNVQFVVLTGLISSTTYYYRIRRSSSCGISAYSSSNSTTTTSGSAGGTVGGNTTICSGNSSGVLTLTGHAGTVQKWQSSVSPFTTWSNISNTNTTYTSNTLSETTKFRAVVVNAGCSSYSASATITVNPVPAASGTITGSGTVSQGQSNVAYSVGAIANATSYSWTYSGTGATINGSTNTPTITFAANATSGNLTVRGVNGCGNGIVSANYPITVLTTCIANEIPGTNSWKGYVYTYTGNTPAATTYVGSVAEKSNFDRDVVAGVITGDTSVEANNFCGTAPSDKFFVRYLMNVTLAEAGNYSITVGGDDGYRLYIDNVLVTALNNWADHSYTSTFTKQVLAAGSHQFKLEYYENGASSRVSFSYGLPKGDPSLPFGDNVWNVYAFSKANLDFTNTELRDSYAGYYIDPAINFSSQNFWNKGQSPSVNNSAWNGAPIQIDNFTLTYKRKGFPCGRYQIQLVNCDDVAQVYLNGTLIFSQTYTLNGGIINNNAFYTLNKDSEIEVRLREDGGDANVAFNFIEVPFVYDGSTAPPAGSSITVNQDSNVANNLDVCSCYITAGKTLTVPANVTLTVRENIDIKTNGKLVVKNNGALLQDNTGVFTGAATSFVMERNSSPMKNFDFTYWSSPVSGQTLFNLSPNTLSDKYFSYGDTGWKQEVATTTTMGAGIGYIIRTPKEGLWGNGENVVFPYAQPVKFIGKPNNGNIVSTQNMTAGKYYLVGNPYPSAMDADAFLFTNVNNRNLLKGTIYFWTHNTGITQSGSKYIYASNDYASYNLTGGTSTSASSPGNKSIPQGYIAAGQSFFAIAETSGNVQFNNSMRPIGNNTQFFKPAKTSKSEVLEKNRLWLNMTNSGGAFKQTLVGYIEGATNDFDLQFDGFSFDGNSFIDFYSVNDTGNLTIQGRSLPFVESDAVPLGYRTTVEGDFTISINNADGVLADQRVYLEDKETNTISELTAKDYTFTTKTGVFNNRFVLRYTNKTLGTGDFETVEDAVSVVVKNKEVSVNSTGDNIDRVYIYDISGKQLYKKENVVNTQLIIQNLPVSQQVLLVKTFLENGNNSTKKVIFH